MSAMVKILHPLTHPYKMPAEDLLLSRAVALLLKGGIHHEIIWNEEQTEAVIWSEPMVDVTETGE